MNDLSKNGSGFASLADAQAFIKNATLFASTKQ